MKFLKQLWDAIVRKLGPTSTYSGQALRHVMVCNSDKNPRYELYLGHGRFLTIPNPHYTEPGKKGNEK